ncbi:MAG: hypothetical protein PHO01_06200 [Desulfotomaculaceae bacterium]|nr:hypothetical protein [Desulfotomaculaceae bacterium]
MRKLVLPVLLILLLGLLIACTNGENKAQLNGDPQQAEEIESQAVVSLVQDFGSKLKKVSLIAPLDTVSQSIQEHYGSMVSPELLAKWRSEPQYAPGKLVSSPWPERIEIATNQKLPDGSYEVKGEIVEIDSVKLTGEEVLAKQPITLIVKKAQDRWLIDDVTLGAESIIYHNSEYDFTFTLPKSWEYYSIVTDQWEGIAVAGEQSGQVVETGQIIKIRHPRWNAKEPRQDIPIMVFTPAQWDSLQKEQISVGAAPVPPRELGRNDKHIFALPARYNYEFLTGHEEVEQILSSQSLQTDE